MALVISRMVLRTAERIRGDTTLSQGEQNVSVSSRSENTQKNLFQIQIQISLKRLVSGILKLT